MGCWACGRWWDWWGDSPGRGSMLKFVMGDRSLWCGTPVCGWVQEAAAAERGGAPTLDHRDGLPSLAGTDLMLGFGMIVTFLVTLFDSARLAGLTRADFLTGVAELNPGFEEAARSTILPVGPDAISIPESLDGSHGGMSSIFCGEFLNSTFCNKNKTCYCHYIRIRGLTL